MSTNFAKAEYDVCFFNEAYSPTEGQRKEVSSFLFEGKTVCTYTIERKYRSRTDWSLEYRKAARFFEEEQPKLIYAEDKHIKTMAMTFPELEHRFVHVEDSIKVMSELFTRLVRDFSSPISNVYILHTASTQGDAIRWGRLLKADKFNVKNYQVTTLKSYQTRLSAMRREPVGIIINLVNVVRDVEYGRDLYYTQLKQELDRSNKRHLTVGVEQTLFNNEAIVFVYNQRDSRADVLLNKRKFNQIGMRRLYLDNSWEHIGGFLRDGQ